MNQRIRELVKQAGFFPDRNWDHTNWHAAGHNDTFEKFAELIVRECAEWLKQPVNQTPLSGAVMNIAADRLKEHFGVEE